jgi:hypothetical protein
MKRTSLVEHNLYFARAHDGGINKRSKPKGLRQKLIIIIIHHAIITTISILNLRPETIAPINVAHINAENQPEICTNICSWKKSGGFKKSLLKSGGFKKSLLLLKIRRI